ncbi:DNA/RNA helicase SEN1 [Nakaseomyces bracarensis]|uniref:DNA/RNA helicase SEN1 n=1 Tax=Nakaseomyces bracarensis TaxID=273131 RepID=UPI003871F974
MNSQSVVRDDVKDQQITEKAQKFIPLIEKVYNGSNTGISESKLLGDVLHFLTELGGYHLFCDRRFEPIAVFCLTIFSFNDKTTIEWLKSRFNPVLSNCDKCVLAFARGKCRMLRHFAIQRNVPHEHVSKFNNLICGWRLSAIKPILEILSQKNIGSTVDLKYNNALYECMTDPNMMRMDKTFRSLFDQSFKIVLRAPQSRLEIGSEKGINTLLAGVIFCWCEGTAEQNTWAKALLKELYNNNATYKKSNIGADVIDEIQTHIIFLQNPGNWNEVIISQFWSRLIPIFSLFEKDIFEEFFDIPKDMESLRRSFKYPIESLVKLWCNHLMKPYQDKPLDFLLRALRLFLDKFKEDFWAKIEPNTFHNILDIILEPVFFLQKLLKLQREPIIDNKDGLIFSFSGSITDLLSWTLPFYNSLSASKRIQMVKKVSISFLRIVANQPSLESVPKACLVTSSCTLLASVLTISESERQKLYNKDDFENVLLTKVDSRLLLDNNLIQNVLLKSISDPDNFYPGLGSATISVSTSTMLVLTTCIDFDLLTLCQRTYKLYYGTMVNDFPLSISLLDNIIKQVHFNSFKNGALLAKLLLSSLKNIDGIVLVTKSKLNTSKHNANIEMLWNSVNRFIESLNDLLPKQLIEILNDGSALQGFWACVFSSNEKLYQGATNILYNTFDVDGRLEGIQALFGTNVAPHLKSINHILARLIKCEYFEPCPRSIKVLMDIVSAFVDPTNGVLSRYDTHRSAETNAEIVNFWQLVWSFLDSIYQCTLKWATKYNYSELENFTKDTLDLSKTLVSSYREFKDILDEPIDLFHDVLKAFKNMLYWLRLSDDSLLESCVSLITNTSDLAQERDMTFDKEIVEMMAKYGAKYKKFSNKLTIQQSTEILDRARIFDKDITNKITEEAEEYHKQKERAKQQTVVIPDEEYHTKTPAEARIEYLQKRALGTSAFKTKASQPKITSFGSFKPTASVSLQTKVPSKPLSKMEIARRQLLNNRVIHPPSTSVFNTKPQKPQSTDNDSSSDESDIDIESARELFATSKSKGKGIETLDISGKTIKINSAAERAKMEEENMRKRLTVDLNPLYSQVLQWDYTRSHDYPDDNTIDRYSDIKDEFKSAKEYKMIMKPLLLLESWQGMCAARDRDENTPFSIVVGNRTTISDFYEIYASISKKKLQESNISESDLIVLANFPNIRPGQRLTTSDFKNADQTCLAKVKTLKNTKGGNVDMSLRIHRNHSFAKFLTHRAEIHAVKVMQMTTIEREYSTLEALEYYDLVDQILSAKLSPPSNIFKEQIAKVRDEYYLNKSQADAIVNTVISTGFSLIQGPPGTGKTKTILGIVGYFMSLRNEIPSSSIQAPTDKQPTSVEQMLKKPKILICAPSNAAVDEICLRVKDGIKTKHSIIRPNVVRLGRTDVVNATLKDVILEEIVDKRLGEKSYEFNRNPELEKKFQGLLSERRLLRDKLDSENGSPESNLSTNDIANLQMKIRELTKDINQLGREKDEMREQNAINYRNRDLDRRNAQAHVLASSDIICSTLSGSAHDVLATLGIRFETVIVDEACQCTELSAIIPLRYGGKRCIMVGDPNQLPPTVLSGAASNFKYNQSLFVRMEKNSTPYLLDVQYRMHPDISKFPSAEFYQKRLMDGPEMDVVNRRLWHEQEPFRPYKFFDIISGKQAQNTRTMSYTNKEEIDVAIEMIDQLFRLYDAKIDFTGKIGVISPYKEQVQKMRREFVKYFGNSVMKCIDFNTIDGFQGQEKEIIIISCVRADDSHNSGVGFLKDFRRMNVALTRAKTSIWILGHQKSLRKSKLWSNLIQDAQDRGCFEAACAGFLNPNNKQVQETLRQYKTKTQHIVTNSKGPKADQLPQTNHSEIVQIKKEPVQIKQEIVQIKKEPLQNSIKLSDTEDDYDPSTAFVAPKKKPVKRRADEGTRSPFIEKKKMKKIKTQPVDENASGTKKKSSIFGANATPKTTSKEKLSSNVPYIKDKSKKEKSLKEAKKNRHVSFSDNIEVIP